MLYAARRAAPALRRRPCRAALSGRHYCADGTDGASSSGPSGERERSRCLSIDLFGSNALSPASRDGAPQCARARGRVAAAAAQSHGARGVWHVAFWQRCPVLLPGTTATARVTDARHSLTLPTPGSGKGGGGESRTLLDKLRSFGRRGGDKSKGGAAASSTSSAENALVTTVRTCCEYTRCLVLRVRVLDPHSLLASMSFATCRARRRTTLCSPCR